MVHTNEEKLSQFGRVLDVMRKLRENCPWNAAQTMESLRPMTVEEVYELSDAILKKSESDIEKELGDVLLHVVFYSRIAEERGEFDIADVMERLCEKMIFRHPHVFSDTKVADAKEVSENWEMLKTKEKGGNKRILSGVPDSLPPILKALAMQDKARGVGFDWECPSQVWDKVREELAELETELSKEDNQEARTAEFGDFIFSLINAARLYHINPDNALEHTNQKFIRRFNYVEAKAKEQGLNLQDMTLAQMDALWNEAKGLESR